MVATTLAVVAWLAASSTAEGPCDIFDAAPEGTPCVAAHSMVRALYQNYAGPLYAVLRASDDTTRDIAPVAPGGYADSASQDAFCSSTACVILTIYDQTTHKNHLRVAPRKDGAHHIKDIPCNATRDKLTIGGHPVYSAYFEGGMGYRIDNTSGKSVYMCRKSANHTENLLEDAGGLLRPPLATRQ